MNPRFFRLFGLQEQSFVISGSIRFPSKERGAVNIENDAFVRIADNQPLKLKSMALADGNLKLVIWGRPSSLKVGPTAGLLNEQLPSHLLWAYTHRTSTLLFSILGWMVGSCIAFLKLFGFIIK